MYFMSVQKLSMLIKLIVIVQPDDVKTRLALFI